MMAIAALAVKNITPPQNGDAAEIVSQVRQTTPMSSRLAERIKYSPLSRFAALPMRLRTGFVPVFRQAGQVLRWWLQSREWANFSYDYDPVGLQAIICVLAELTGRSPADLRGFAQELKSDTVFAERYHQHASCRRIERTGMPHAFLMRRAPNMRDDIMRCHTGGLVDVEKTVHQMSSKFKVKRSKLRHVSIECKAMALSHRHRFRMLNF